VEEKMTDWTGQKPGAAGEAAEERDRNRRLAVLPRFPLPGLSVVVLTVLVLVLGLTVTHTPGIGSWELTVDQEWSRDHVSVLSGLAMVLNSVFAPAVGLLIVLAVGSVIALRRREPLRAVSFVLVSCMGWASSEVFKLIIARQRPDQAMLIDPLAPETGSNSFPSGHVAFAVALAFAVYFQLRPTRYARAAAVAGPAVALLVAWSRVYIGVHYPTDVLASFLAATAAVILFTVLWNRWLMLLLPRLPLVGRVLAPHEYTSLT
jgi:membrane-associated phospholipid phosphatase